MTIAQQLKIEDYTYDLPENLIAKFPLHERDASKLLIYDTGNIEEDIYKNLAARLPGHCGLIFNNTRVIPARLIFFDNNTPIEIFCLEPAFNINIASAMAQSQQTAWNCFVGNAKKWKTNMLEKQVYHDGIMITVQAEKISRAEDHFIIRFQWYDATLSFAELLQLAGAIPLPPYLNRDAEDTDRETYQTIYARQEGSVAAPTAGLHFTEALFKKLHAKNINTSYITLHVGAGTFKPVKAATMQQHTMHAEYAEVDITLLQQLIKESEKIIAVGTTSLRTLESLYWLGIAPESNSTVEGILQVSQWQPYQTVTKLSATQALSNLICYMQHQQLTKLVFKTSLLIVPGYTFKIVKGLITNFHQPKSTLLLLVAALIGDDWKKLYNYALQNQFRFLSYGDGCLLLPNRLA